MKINVVNYEDIEGYDCVAVYTFDDGEDDGDLQNCGLEDDMRTWLDGFMDGVIYVCESEIGLSFEVEEFNSTKILDGVPEFFSELKDVLGCV